MRRLELKKTLTTILLSFTAFGLNAEEIVSEEVRAVAPIATSKQITVMSYNIQQLGYPNWFGNHFEKERLALIPETVLAMENQPDILIFQEAFTDYSFKFLVEKLMSVYPYHTAVAANSCSNEVWTSAGGACDGDSIKGNSGVFILSRWPMDEKHSIVYESVRVSYTFDFLAQKGAAYASINADLGGRVQKIHVVGTHLQADGGSHDIRMMQLEEMRVWLDSLKIPKNEPVIMGGDFNVSSKTTKKLANMLSQTNTWMEFGNNGIGTVSPSSNQYLTLIYALAQEKNLDYILYRVDHLQPKNNPLLQAVNFKSALPWKGARTFSEDVELTDLSDHYPVLAVFEF